MAVRAHHLALLDLPFDGSERPTLPLHCGDVHELRLLAKVVEVHCYVMKPMTAVSTWDVFCGNKKLLSFCAVPLVVLLYPSKLSLSVLEVPLLVVLLLAPWTEAFLLDPSTAP